MTRAVEEAMVLTDDEKRKKSIQKLELEYRNCNWITPRLSEEIQLLFPTAEDIDTINNNQWDLDKFKKNMKSFCTPGRFFSSPYQFHQALKLLCSKWSVSVAHRHFSIVCHYCKRDTYKPHHDVSKRRKPRESRSYSCPFAIRYSIPGMPRKNRKPRMLYRVKLTTVNLHHTCSLNTSGYRVALERSCGINLNFDSMKDVVSLIQINPTMRANELRPLIARHVPSHQSLTAQYIANFRNKVIRYISANGVDGEVTQKDATALLNNSVTEETVSSD